MEAAILELKRGLQAWEQVSSEDLNVSLRDSFNARQGEGPMKNMNTALWESRVATGGDSGAFGETLKFTGALKAAVHGNIIFTPYMIGGGIGRYGVQFNGQLFPYYGLLFEKDRHTMNAFGSNAHATIPARPYIVRAVKDAAERAEQLMLTELAQVKTIMDANGGKAATAGKGVIGASNVPDKSLVSRNAGITSYVMEKKVVTKNKYGTSTWNFWKPVFVPPNPFMKYVGIASDIRSVIGGAFTDEKVKMWLQAYITGMAASRIGLPLSTKRAVRRYARKGLWGAF